MQLFETLRLKFEQPNWALNPEFGLLDTNLDQNPTLLTIVSSDILAGTKQSDFGSQDIPSVEQIVRAAIYKEMKKLDYRELEYAQDDSKICQQFIKIDNRKPFSFQICKKSFRKLPKIVCSYYLYP